jgi:histidinol-phosphate/aromatic aminotransferase/cobyric acid decarboxylase-like protein
MYKVCAKVNDVQVNSCPLTPDFDVDVPATISALDENTK